MKRDITKYQTIVFDCDGVVLDSNITKIDSYFRTARKLGGSNHQAQALVDYHVKFGGMASWPKFKWYIEEILKQEATNDLLKEYLDTFGLAINRGLMTCRLAEGLTELKKRTAHANWVVVSEGMQIQMQTVFKDRELTHFFDGGVYGSPDDKNAILLREIENGNIQMPALFIGDSCYDYEASIGAGLDFVFLSEWSDLATWKDFCAQNDINVCRNLKSLIEND